MVRVRGRLTPMEGYPTLTPTDTREIVYSILSESQRQRFENNWQLDFAYSIPGHARFRVNAYYQRGAIGAAFRLIPFGLTSIDELGLPATVHEFTRKPRGFVLVTGPTGSGKSTTLAALIDVVKDVTPMRVGGFIYPISEFATPPEELGKRLGYQEDTGAALKEARTLLTAAGHANGIQGLDFMVRDVASFKLWAQAIQAMLQEGLNVQCNLRTVVESVWFDDVAAGHYDLAIGAVVSTLLDPSDYFNAWYRTGGPQNYSSWDNPKFNALLDQIDREVDPAKRKALVRQTEAIMEEDPPVLPVAWEKINDVWYNYVKGHNPYDYFGVYDVVREDTFWLDKA